MIEAPMCVCGDKWHEHNAANHAPTCPVLDAFAALTQRAEAAEAEIAELRASTGLRVVQNLRAECEALRQDAALLDALQAEHERFDPVAALVVKVKHDRNSSDWANITGDIRAALTAALAVQP